ncbi:MAG: tetratricopeptide repeat protein [Bacteroidales bacterium]|nr:tetratricopeptide repeat protein [Bacteroidales bacterium]
MSKKKKPDSNAGFESVENALTRTEKYIEENQKSLSIIILAIIVFVGGYLGYKKLYLEPANMEAHAAMYIAEQYFEADSFSLALMGDGANFGILDIIDEYGMTSAANLAHYYAGICYLRMGQYEDAIEHLKDFDTDDILVASIALGDIGDCYAELGDYKKALTYYLKAGQRKKNSFTSPIFLRKAGIIYEEIEDFDKALEIYQTIKSEYPESDIGMEMDKYIGALRVKMM